VLCQIFDDASLRIVHIVHIVHVYCAKSTVRSVQSNTETTNLAHVSLQRRTWNASVAMHSVQRTEKETMQVWLQTVKKAKEPLTDNYPFGDVPSMVSKQVTARSTAYRGEGY
jgi:hypothetical protein